MYLGCNDVKYVVVHPSSIGDVGVVDWFKDKPSNLKKYPKCKGYNLEEVRNDDRGIKIRMEIQDIIISKT